jgi:hypothetical protein
MNRPTKSSCPYSDLPDSSRWERTMARRPLVEINPHTGGPVKRYSSVLKTGIPSESLKGELLKLITRRELTTT